MKVLDLFSGLGGFSQAFKDRGHKVTTIDIEEKFHPDICVDIMNLESCDFLGYDVVLASPPCNCFSVASIGKHWTGGYRAYKPKTKEAINSIRLIKHTVSMLSGMQPKIWFIENPVGVLRKLNLVGGFHHTITLCRYGDTRMKPTDIWTNSYQWMPRPRCNNGNPDHEKAPRGSKTGTQGLKNSAERAKLPYELSMSICLACEYEVKYKLILQGEK